jgi:hypothetical protein
MPNQKGVIYTGPRAAIAAALALALVFPSPASAAPARDASEPPRTSGPLYRSPFGCEDNGPGRPGESRMQVCVWSYDLLPAETNAAEDYSVYWAQFEADPARGSCIYDVRYETSAPASARMVSAAPEDGGTGGMTTVELNVDAEGSGPMTGIVAQDLALPKGRIRTRLRPDSFSYHWSGKTSAKLVLAMGVQMASPVPPELIGARSESLSLSTGPCRHDVVTRV